jgi:3-oxoacyl-[acyl-carrier protein] reductase
VDFKDRTVLVTGASRGIGAAIARAFAAEGALVAVNYLANAQAAEDTVAACKAAGGDAFAAQADVTDPEAATGLVESVMAEAGKIDALVNNAFRPYVFDPEKRKLFWDTEWADYQAQMEGAVSAAYHLCKAALPAMRSRASGAIVNMASDLVARAVVPYHEYNTAKSALVGFTRSLASSTRQTPAARPRKT